MAEMAAADVQTPMNGEALPGYPYQPAQALRLHEHVVQQVVQQVVSGDLAPGSALPTEPELAQRFGVSRTVVREAVRVLVAKGLITVRQGSGMRVEPLDHWDHLDPLVIFERIRAGTDDSLLSELIEMRRILETEVAALAAVRRNEADLGALTTALAQMEGALGSPDTFTQHDVEFHEVLLLASGNRLIREAMLPVAGALRQGRIIAVQKANILRRSLSSHRAIYQAVVERDAAAARAAALRHVQEFESDVRAGLRSWDDASAGTSTTSTTSTNRGSL